MVARLGRADQEAAGSKVGQDDRARSRKRREEKVSRGEANCAQCCQGEQIGVKKSLLDSAIPLEVCLSGESEHPAHSRCLLKARGHEMIIFCTACHTLPRV